MSRTLEALAHVQEEIDEPIIQASVDSTGAGGMYTPASIRCRYTIWAAANAVQHAR
jgi:hypothetical protein